MSDELAKELIGELKKLNTLLAPIALAHAEGNVKNAEWMPYEDKSESDYSDHAKVLKAVANVAATQLGTDLSIECKEYKFKG